MAKNRTIDELQRRVAAERKLAGTKRVRFSAEIRRDIVELVGATWRSPDQVAKQLGLSSSTIRTWRSAACRRSEATKKKRMALPRLRPVEVVASSPESKLSALSLRFPSGAELEMSVSDLRQLLGLER